jgi:hypothetical protein
MSALRRVTSWCVVQGLVVSGWLGFVMVGAIVGQMMAIGALGVYWIAHIQLHQGIGLLALGALPCALFALACGWLLLILLRLHGAPWRSMLLAVLVEGWAMWVWLDQPFRGW